MRNVGSVPKSLHKLCTLQHNGRVFKFLRDSSGLFITELFLGKGRLSEDVLIASNCKQRFCCCSLGSKILLVSGERRRGLALSITVPDDELTVENVKVEVLEIINPLDFSDWFFLCPSSETSAFIIFAEEEGTLWRCDVEERRLRLGAPAKFSETRRLSAIPLHVSDSKAVVIGAFSDPREISCMSVNDGLAIQPVGRVPVAGDFSVLTILPGERFLVGLSGETANALDRMWVFSLETGKGSALVEKGAWMSVSHSSSLFFSEDALYVAANGMPSYIAKITLPDISELIYDDAVREEFCQFFELPSIPIRFSVIPPLDDSVGMRNMKLQLENVMSYKAVQVDDRVFHFSIFEKKLRVAEIVFGQGLMSKSVTTNLHCKLGSKPHLGCCAFADRILVVVGTGDVSLASPRKCSMLAVLVSVAEGNLSADAVDIEELTVDKPIPCPESVYLVQISENTVGLSFHDDNALRICKITGQSFIVTDSCLPINSGNGFGVPPTQLSDRKLIVAGGWPGSTDIIRITVTSPLKLEVLGTMPGKARWGVSLIVLEKRFVIGFGGETSTSRSDSLWMFDLQTKKTHSLTKTGAWHSPASGAFLAIWNATLYIIGGFPASPVYSMPLISLAFLITDSSARSEFLTALVRSSQARTRVLQRKLEGARTDLRLAQGRKEELEESGIQTGDVIEDRAVTALIPEAPGDSSVEPSIADAKPPCTAAWGADGREDGIFILLPFVLIPHLSFPLAWKWDAGRFDIFCSGIRAHTADLQQDEKFQAEYKRVYMAFSERKFPDKLLAAQASRAPWVAYFSAVAQAASALCPGTQVPRAANVQSLTKLPPTRLAEKLLDPERVQRCQAFVCGRLRTTHSVRDKSPPVFKKFWDIFDAYDPAAAERAQQNISQLRRVLQVSRIALLADQRLASGGSSELAEGRIETAIKLFQKMKRAADAGYAASGDQVVAAAGLSDDSGEAGTRDPLGAPGDLERGEGVGEVAVALPAGFTEEPAVVAAADAMDDVEAAEAAPLPDDHQSPNAPASRPSRSASGALPGLESGSTSESA